MARKSTSRRRLRYPDIPDAVARADRRGDLPALSADLRGLSAKAANAATRMDRIDRTMSGLSVTAEGLARRLAELEGKLAELRAESARPSPSPTADSLTADSGAAALADSLAALIGNLRAAIGQMDRARTARAAVLTPLAQSTHDAAAVGARAALLAQGFESAPPLRLARLPDSEEMPEDSPEDGR